MPVVPATAFLAGAALCAIAGRFLMIRKASGVSVGWLLTVLLVPFGPFIFRLKYPELARPTQLWRDAAAVLVLLFFLDGGNVAAIRHWQGFGRPGAVQDSAGDTDFHLPTPDKLVAATVGENGNSPAAPSPGKPTVAPPTPTPAPAPVSTSAPPAPAPAPAATPSPAVAAAIAKMAAAPRVLTREERIRANRQEYERLAAWYDRLKHERGYLLNGDTDALDAYNAEVRQYQAALQIAKDEAGALANLTAQK